MRQGLDIGSRKIPPAVLLLFTILGSTLVVAVQAAGPGVAPPRVTSSAVNYLLANYNSTVGLVRESPDSPTLSNTYYLYSDNFLATLAIQDHAPNNSTLVKVSSNITKSIHRYIQGQPNPVNQYEVLTSLIPAFNGSKNFIIYTRGLETINTTANNNSPKWLDLHDYADIAFLEAVYYYRMGNNSAARSAYQVGVAMYDGIGFKDSVAGNYQTYKLALYVYASRLLGHSYDKSAFNQLIAMQADSGVDKGGFYTCYDSNATARCGTNAETTALALLAREPQPNSLTVSCNHTSVVVGSTTACKAKVYGSAPTGSVAWSSSGSGTFSRASCTLSKHKTYSTCSVRFTPTAAGSPVILTAGYNGDSKNFPSAGAYNLTVTMKVTTTTVSCKPSSVVAGSSRVITCTAKATGYLPTGEVSLSQSGTGSVSLSSTTCTLASLTNPNKATCSVTMVGTTAGKVTLQATYSGDSNNQGSLRKTTLTIRKP